MRITESQLRRVIRAALLTEEIFGAQAFVYTGTDVEPDYFYRIIESGEFRPGGGDIFGKGLYAVTDTNRDVNTLAGNYGKYVYKLKVNLNGFVIFDADACRKVYGKWIPVRDQLLKLGFEREVRAFEKQKKPSGPVPLEDNPAAVLRMTDAPPPAGQNTDQFALALYRGLFSKKPVMGMVFTRNRGNSNDGQVTVIYEPQTVVPVAWKEASDETWTKFEGAPSASISRSVAGVSPTRSSARDLDRAALNVIYDQTIDDGNGQEHGRKNFIMELMSQVHRRGDKLSPTLNGRQPADLPAALERFVKLFYYMPDEKNKYAPKKLTDSDVQRMVSRITSAVPELGKTVKRKK